jgi:hypothetical protein
MVDRLKHYTRDAYTIFQRMNDEGDGQFSNAPG